MLMHRQFTIAIMPGSTNVALFLKDQAASAGKRSSACCIWSEAGLSLYTARQSSHSEQGS